MTLFLTSSPTGPLDGARSVDGIDELNGFAEALRRRWPGRARCLIVAASPEEYAGNDEMAGFFAAALERSGMAVASFEVWDGRTARASALDGCDVIFLGGGHVPTQNAFFRRLGLRERIAGFDGIVVGISAGTMNAAARVYAQPELPGEASDPGYVRWLDGLGLTGRNILPHYQMVRDSFLDGRRLFEDITYQDSAGHTFLAIPDGSYILSEDGAETLYGAGWRIADGQCEQICEEGRSQRL